MELQLNGSVEEVLARIRDSTERETLPFISDSTYPTQREKEFVSSVSDNRVRIWKVPSSSRRRQNISVPYFSGKVVKTDEGCYLRGRFALHPFSKVFPLIPLAIAGPIWLWTNKTERFFLIVVTLISLLAVIILVGAVRRLRPQEERDIVQFLFKLFPEARGSLSAKV